MSNELGGRIVKITIGELPVDVQAEIREITEGNVRDADEAVEALLHYGATYRRIIRGD